MNVLGASLIIALSSIIAVPSAPMVSEQPTVVVVAAVSGSGGILAE